MGSALVETSWARMTSAVPVEAVTAVPVAGVEQSSYLGVVLGSETGFDLQVEHYQV